MDDFTDADRETAANLLAAWKVQRTDEGALSVREFVYLDDWRDALAAALADAREHGHVIGWNEGNAEGVVRSW